MIESIQGKTLDQKTRQLIYNLLNLKWLISYVKIQKQRATEIRVRFVSNQKVPTYSVVADSVIILVIVKKRIANNANNERYSAERKRQQLRHLELSN